MPASAFKSLPGGLDGPQVQRIQTMKVISLEQERPGVENFVETAHVSATIRPGVVDVGGVLLVS